MWTVRARASCCVLAVLAGVFTACTGDARRVGSAPLTVRLGTFPAAVDSLVDLFSAEPLISVGWNGREVYRLAESASWSPDGRTIELKLRRNVKFHSGEIVRAPRVRELLLDELRTEEASPISAVRAQGEDTIVLDLAKPHGLQLVDLTEYPIYDAERPALRTGPFRIASAGETPVLERFADYHLGTPGVSTLEIHQYASNRAAWTAIMRGEVNVLHEVNREAIDFIQAGGNIVSYPTLRPYYVALVFNQRHPVLKRADVRVALNESVDRSEVVQTGMRGHGRAAEGPFWPYHWAYPPSSGAPEYNPQAAELRLDAAGLPVRPRGAEGMPSRFTFTCLLLEGDARFERIALVVQRQLFTIGVDMRLQPVPVAEFGRRLAAGDFDAFLFEMTSGRTLSWVYSFWRSPGLTRYVSTGYTGADAALDRMKNARREEDIRIAVADVMRVMRADPPAVFLVWPHEARAVDRAIEIPHEQERDVLGTLWLARPANLPEPAG